MRHTTAFGAALLAVVLFIIPAHGGGVTCMRRMGPPSLAALMTEYADAISRHREGAAVENWAKISAELDAVAGQRDAWASGLYWYDDLEAAKAAATREGKPIVSLRMLGRLNADLSCANSRFFRTTLYPAAEVSRRLRERFVLHWSSERPVPVVTVDFGDGRKLERTVTGNSAHYMMTPDGAVVDVLPGLYGAKPFAAWLDEAGGLATRIRQMQPSDRTIAIRTHHARKRDEVASRWAADQLAVGAIPADPALRETGTTLTNGVPARAAGRLSISKNGVEQPIALLASVADPNADDERLWSAIAGLHDADAALDPAAVALIRSKRPSGGVDRVLPVLRRTIAQDTVRNEYTLHQTVHAWFASGSAPLAFEPLNERVYAELFLTPRSDPWLGLAPANAWSGLDDDGLAVAAK